MIGSEQLCLHYSLADIRLATHHFDDGLVIGQGGFGKVYKGHVEIGEGSSTVVAIKRLDSTSNQGAPEFRAEVEMLSKLRHSHLVSLLGFCDDGKEMILVYEYMPHETVYHHLHKSNTPLSWMQRLRISIGAARGLDYLHTGAGTKHGVIHRDVKTSNILLDEDWAAKISDFGLAKICPTNQSSTYVNTGIKGTFGYLDPHIFLTGKFTRKTDVFAFGVVLFELLSGRQAVFPDEDLSLTGWARKCVKRGNTDQVVDAEIRGQLSPKSLKVFAQMAYRCVHKDPKERPTMSEVVVALEVSLALQEKFNNSAKPLGLIGFTWKMASYFVLPAKENSGHGGEYNEVLPDTEQIVTQDLKVFSYTDLKCATRNFQNAIMTTGHCVFKGWVHEKTYSPSDQDVGLTIIVKNVGHRPEPQGSLQLLDDFRHPNLHSLLGYCLEEHRFYLVYEFMGKRTLKDYLDEEATTELPFIMRVKIAVGVARGLVFLHRKQLFINDRILDTNDIWLDKDFNANLFYYDVTRMKNQFPQQQLMDGEPILARTQIDPLKKILLCGEFDEMSDKMIKDAVDPRIKPNAPQIERARELLLLIQKCTLHHYTMEQALEKLEQIYNKMTKR